MQFDFACQADLKKRQNTTNKLKLTHGEKTLDVFVQIKL